MNDKQFLTWIHERLVHVHNENNCMDYMWKLRAIIQAVPDEQVTPNIMTELYLEGMTAK